jgi:hypothetical protein
MTASKKSGKYLSVFSLLFAFVFSSIAFLPSESRAADESETTLRTVGGVLRVANSQSLTLNNKLLMFSKDSQWMESGMHQGAIVRLKQKFNVEGNDVVLIKTNCVSKGCENHSYLHFLTITPAGKDTVSSGIYIDNHGTPDVKQIDNTLTLAVTGAPYTDIWTYVNGDIERTSLDDPSETLKTVGGVLRVVNHYGRRVTLNNKDVYYEKTGGEVLGGDHVSLTQKFSVAGNDVVLVSINCGGSGCGGSSSLYVATITPAGKVTVSDAMEANEDGDADVKVTGTTLMLTTKTYDGRRSKTHRWVYANGKVAKAK